MKIFNDEAPIYLQLRKHIEELILERKLPEEAQIPSIRVMARDFKLNPITVGNALSSLVEEGILHKKRGVGIFVSGGARELIISERGKDFITDSLEPVLKKARQLELSREKVIELTKTIYGGKDE
ncbi:MAG: GntR family transcriptional regulator [Candidatus Cloacimonetes bacterium]|jgi:DNA-binding transcriptional regulator YhcF (GntR family)|nr:GntR family transcriptional regulator [Candidatus Cloacimonadota bacterium]